MKKGDKAFFSIRGKKTLCIIIDIKRFSVDVQAVESGLCFRISGLSMEAA